MSETYSNNPPIIVPIKLAPNAKVEFSVRRKRSAKIKLAMKMGEKASEMPATYRTGSESDNSTLGGISQDAVKLINSNPKRKYFRLKV